MRTTISYPFLLSIGIGLLFWYGNHFFEGSEQMRLVLLNTVQLFVGILSTSWIIKSYFKNDSSKRFWMFLGLGTSFSALGTLAWIILLVKNHVMVTPDLSSLTWVCSYFFYFAALLNQLLNQTRKFSNSAFFFNTMIYMIAATSISYHYLLYPLYQINQQSLWYSAHIFLFQIADLGILFFIITLYYLILFNKQNVYLTYLIIGLFLQVIGDITFAQFTIKNSYISGGSVDLIWTIALLFIGYTARYHEKEPRQESMIDPFALDVSTKKEFIFPYSSILILSILMMQSYAWNLNALSTGWIMIFLLIIIRQAFTVMKNSELLAELNQIAYIDPLTSLGNRASFLLDTKNSLKDEHAPLAFILLQVERIRMYTDIFGHHVGEQIMKEVSFRLKHVLKENFKMYRYSEDEFMIVLLKTEKSSITVVNEKLFIHLAAPIRLKELELNIVAHSGVSVFPDQSLTIEEIQAHTAEALYQAKQNGNYTFVYYGTELQSNLVRKLEIESYLRNAIREQQLSVYYQPKVNLRSGRIIGMEALLRWHHPKFGWISPAEFIPIAEEAGLINEIGEWVLFTATYQSKQLQLLGFEPLLLSVNVSVLQFQNPNFCQRVIEILEETSLDPQWLELEITESIVQNIKESVSILQCLKTSQIKTSIDDFGTGYSSLNVLEQLPIDTLKIDKSFIDRLTPNQKSPMVKTIIELGLNLNLTVVAEGIETIEQKEVLTSYGCTIGQGYLFSRPIDFAAFVTLLQTQDVLKTTSL